MNYTEHSLLLSPVAAPLPWLVEQIRRRPTGEYTEYDVTHIVELYAEYCQAAGLNLILTLAQMLHETGNLTSFWAAREQRNPAGIGVNGRVAKAKPTANPTAWAFNTQRQQWEMGLSFTAWRHSVPAHVGRLLAYALPADQGTPAQRELIRQALIVRSLPNALRGSAPTLRRLGKAHNPTGQGWASPGIDYGQRVAITANWLVGGAA